MAKRAGNDTPGMGTRAGLPNSPALLFACRSAPQIYLFGWSTTLYLSKKPPTTTILQSLQPGNIEAPNVKSDGRIMNGNTRIKILEERGVGVNSLSREMLS
jgi:hypothetical protein